MTTSNINIILANAVCCVATKAVEVSKLLSIGDKCAYKEAIKLKMLNHYINTLRCYIATDSNNLVTNGTFDTDLTGWTITDIWNIELESEEEGNVIFHDGHPTLGGSFSQDILEIGNTYNITFYFRYDDLSLDTSTPSNLMVSAGSVQTNIIKDTGTYSIDITLECLESTLLAFSVNPDSKHYYIDNIVVKKLNTTCLTTSDMDVIIEKIMTACDICACELT